MKKKLLFIFIFTMIGLSLLSCGSDPTEVLDVPSNVKVTDRLISWDSVGNASRYDLLINQTVYTTDHNQFSIPSDVFGDVTIQVKAVKAELESEYSSEITVHIILKLETPTGLEYVNNQIVWNSVSGASGYIVNINGAEFFTENTFYPYEIEDGAIVKVLAVGSLTENTESSAYTNDLTLTVALDSPQNIALSNGYLNWDAVDGATAYVLVIDSGNELEVSSNTYEVGFNYVGIHSVKIRAINSDGLFSDSVYTSQDILFPGLTIDVPRNLDIVDGVLTFDPVAYADEYEIYLKGVLYTTITTTTYTIPSNVLDDPSGYIELRAVSYIHQSSDLSLKMFVNLIEITNESDLINMASVGNYILTQDIALSSPWLPKDFSGVFDGNGYSITNILISMDDRSIGFFKTIDNSVIKDLSLSGRIDVSTNTYQAEIGGLAGYISYSDIENVQINFDILAHSFNGVGNLGGVFGRIQNSNVKDMTFIGDITAENFTVGGFAGRADNPEVLTEITKVDVEADIVVVGGEQSMVGGFIGFLANNSLTIQESSADIDITGTVYVGGFIGYFGSGHIHDAYVIGRVQAVNDILAHVGGFVGRLEGYNSSMTHCISQVNVVQHAQGDNIYIGGFSGYTLGGTYAQIYDNCYYDDLGNNLDRIGNPSMGRGDEITRISISEISEISGFDGLIWDFSGLNPSFTWN